MNVRLAASSLLACVLSALPGLTIAQTSQSADPGNTGVTNDGGKAPIFDSSVNADRPASHHFASPEDDARPGEYFFGLAVQAFRKQDYVHAVDMYKVAASWAYKPAEYNLGVMYARGTGVPVNLSRAMAWLTLAAERNDPNYMAARDLVNSKLSDAQFKQANVIFGQLLPTFGDATALVRAKGRWAQVRASMTGSRTGSLAGNLKIGGNSNGNVDPGARLRTPTGAGGILGSGSLDGSIAYQQLVASNNPYDPKFEWRPGSGTVTVKPLTPIKKADADRAGKPGGTTKDNTQPN